MDTSGGGAVITLDPNTTLANDGSVNLFQIPPTNITTTDAGQWLSFHPLSSSIADGQSSIQFKITNLGSRYLQLRSAYLYTRCKIVRNNGDAAETITPEHADPQDAARRIPASKTYDRVIPTQNFAVSLFRNLTVYLNGTQISHFDLLPYKAYLDIILNAPYNVQKHYLHAQLCSHEGPASSMENLDAATDNDLNKDLQERWRRTKGSQMFECVSRVEDDLFNLDLLLLPSVEILLEFTPTPPEFRVLCKDDLYATHKYKVVIDSFQLFVKSVSVIPSIALSIEQRLARGDWAVYPLQGSSIQIRPIPAGTKEIVLEDLWSSRTPSKVFFCFVDANATQGKASKSPFNFKPLNITSAELIVDGRRMKDVFDFSKETPKFMQSYYKFLHCLGSKHVPYSYSFYSTHGFILAYQLDTSLEQGTLPPVTRSSIRLHCVLNAETDVAYNVIC